jgi:hypothetical protein
MATPGECPDRLAGGAIGQQEVPGSCRADRDLLLPEDVALLAAGAGQESLLHRHLGGEAKGIGRSGAVASLGVV